LRVDVLGRLQLVDLCLREGVIEDAVRGGNGVGLVHGDVDQRLGARRLGAVYHIVGDLLCHNSIRNCFRSDALVRRGCL
jgi:hypothetical protein